VHGLLPQRVVGLIFDSLKVVSTPQRLLTHDEFSLFMFPAIDENGPIGDGLNVESMVMENLGFQSTIERINEHLTDAFDEVRVGLQRNVMMRVAVAAGLWQSTAHWMRLLSQCLQYARVFQPFRLTAMDNLLALSEMTKDVYASRTLVELKQLFTRFYNQQVMFEGIPTVGDVGIIQINSRLLRLELKPSPTRYVSDASRYCWCLSHPGAMRRCAMLCDGVLVFAGGAAAVSTSWASCCL
jgi:hypothetical protein